MVQDMTIAEIKKFKDQGLPVIVFGAGVVGEAAFHACKDSGIDVALFCDNNINKTRKKVFGREVVHTRALKQRHKNAIIVISAADIKDAREQLKELGYEKSFDVTSLLRDFDVYKHQFSAPQDFVQYAVATCMLCQDKYLCPENVFMRSVDIIITEKCSLKCRDCSNLMQYYKKPADSRLEDLLRSIDAFISVIDEVNEFRVIGGEPFMNRDWPAIVKRLTAEPKVKRVVIYTNGTIVPKEEDIACCKDKKTLLIITDYGKLSRNLAALIKVSKKNGIAYYAHEARGWTDCASIKKHNRSSQQQREVFRCCCAKNTTTLSDGKLYRCPFSANADRLRAFVYAEGDRIDISKVIKDQGNILSIKENIRSFLLGKEYLEACDYCKGRSFDAMEITPAIQTARPLEFALNGEDI